MANVVVKTGDLSLLASMIAGGSMFRVNLYKNDVVPTVNTIRADLTAADFSGYLAVDTDWSTPAINGAGKAQTDCSEGVYTHNGGGTDNTIYGAFVDNEDGDVLIYAERFPAPILMDADGAEIRYTARFTCVTE